MADQKISELTALTGADVADNDAIAIVDTSALATKKIVFSELKNALDTATGFVRITGDTVTGDLSLESCDLMVYTSGTSVSAPIDLFDQSKSGVALDDIGYLIASRSDAPSGYFKRYDSDGQVVRFRRNTSFVGDISVTTTSTSFNTSSDYRLKTDVQTMTGATDRLKQLNPVNFEWISDGTRVDGFLAHEAQAVVPEAVTGTKDAVDDEGNPDYQGIDQSKLVPLLVATIKELEARITALENA
jgi:hypothetical protein